jgi:hypothetical protein
MPNNAELFMTHLDAITGGIEPAITKIDSTHEGMRPVYVFTYRNWPQPDFITGFTFGLSESTHPDWKYGRPELMISVESLDHSWCEAIGYMAERLRGDCPFCYGLAINFCAEISDHSQMDAFLIFGPPHLDKSMQSVTLNDYTCNIAGMWPMYSTEIEIYNELGLEKFWHHDDWDPMNVNRPPITVAGG